MKITYAKADGTNVEVEATAEYVAQNEKEVQWYQNKIAEEQAEAQAKRDNQASGNQKFLDMGLTQAEATALTGYTPPVEE